MFGITMSPLVSLRQRPGTVGLKYPDFGSAKAGSLAGSGFGSRRAVTLLPGIAFAGAVVLGASLGAYELFYEAVRCLR